MSERRVCNRRDCDEYEDITATGFLVVRWNGDTSHFCSPWCLTTWAMRLVSPRQVEHYGPLPVWPVGP